MHGAVVGPAEEGQVVQVGGAAIQPVPQMMGFAPGKGPVAAGEHPAAVADGQGGALGGLDDPGGPTDLQGLAWGPTQGRGQQGRGGLQPGRQPSVAAGMVVAAGIAVAVVADGVLVVVAGGGG
jgi:hypothetical protein